MSAMRRIIATIGAGALLAVGACSTDPDPDAEPQADPTPQESGPLSILLTNDDGWGAPGIVAVRRALLDAGHEVTVVAPADNQSGVSSAIAFAGDLTVEQPEEGVYAVATTPAGSVLFGINEVFKDGPPDLVVSGTNVGANTGFDQNFSGTVGAAIVASGMYDIPAIAISTDTAYGQEEEGAYTETADLLVELLKGGVPTLERGDVININYPQLDGEGAPEVRAAVAAPQSAAAFAYEQVEGTDWRIVPARSEEEPAEGSDAALLAEGYVTITLLNADRTVTGDRSKVVDDLVASLP